MMNLTNMKVTGSQNDTILAADQQEDQFPYGLRVNLTEKEMEKLGIKDLPNVGDTVMIHAMAEVQSVSQSESQDGGMNKNISYQITDMAIEKGQPEGGEEQKKSKPFADSVDRFYGENTF